MRRTTSSMSGSSIVRSRTSAAGGDVRRARPPPSSPRRRTRAAGAGRRPRSRRGSRPGRRSGRASARRGRRRGRAARRRVPASPGSVPSKASRPWSTTRTRSQSRSMSPRSWVVSSSVVPRSRRSATRNSRSRCLLSTSRPIVGSSRKSSSGACSSAAAISPRIRWPSDSWRTGVSSSGAHLEQLDELGRCGAGPRRRRAGGSRPRIANESRSGRSHHSCVRWPKTTPIRRASSTPLAQRVEPARAHRARGRHQDAGEHLDRGRLPGAVGADVADRLARAATEKVIRVDGGDRRRVRRRPALAAHEELAGQVLHVDDRPRAGMLIRRLLGSAGCPQRHSSSAASPQPAAAASGVHQASHVRQPRRPGQVEDRQRRQVGDEGGRHDEAEEQPQRVGKMLTRLGRRTTRRR